MRHRGKVRIFDENRGCGFIRRESGGADCHVHYTDIEGDGFRTLHEGGPVEYDLVETSGGPRAVRVRSIDDG